MSSMWVILAVQLSTMCLIGLWHGVTINFLIWGLWHGMGLFLHNRWSEFSRSWYARLHGKGRLILDGLGTVLTFHYVVLGWVFFAIPQAGVALDFLGLLFGSGA